MDNHFGYSAFVLLLSDLQHDLLEETILQFSDFADIVEEYAVEKNKGKYWFVQVDMMDYHRTAEELCHFAFTYFDFIAMRQEGSQFILIPDEDNILKAWEELYIPGQEIYFLYDMLSIEERYSAACNASLTIDPYGDYRLIHDVNGAKYSISFGKECKHLFQEDPEIEVLDSYTNISTIIDISDGLDLFKFNVAILH